MQVISVSVFFSSLFTVISHQIYIYIILPIKMININFIIVKILLDISTSNPTEKFKDKRFIWSFDNCYMLLSV